MRVAVGVGAVEYVPSSCVGAADRVGMVGFAVAVFDASAVCVKITDRDEDDEIEDELLAESDNRGELDVLAVAEIVLLGESDDVTDTEPVTLREPDVDDETDAEYESEGVADPLFVTETDFVNRGVKDGEGV